MTRTHAWASTEVMPKDHEGLAGMPRDGDPCSFPGCLKVLREGEIAVAVNEVPHAERLIEERSEAWIGQRHPTHWEGTDTAGFSGTPT